MVFSGHRARYWNTRAYARYALFERYGDAEDLDVAITYVDKALQATPAGHRLHVASLSNLSGALLSRYVRDGVAADLDAAVEAAQQALQADRVSPRDRSQMLSNLGNLFTARFLRDGVAADLDAAINYYRESAQGISAHRAGGVGRVGLAQVLSNLGASLLIRFERDGVAADLDAAVDIGQQAVQGAPAKDPRRAGYLSNLGSALRSRYERDGVAADLEAAVEIGQQAAQTAPAGHPDHAGSMANLALALRCRFEHSGGTEDLNAAVKACQQAVQAIPVGHPDSIKHLSNLANLLVIRLERAGSVADLDVAVEACQQAVQAIPTGNPDRPGFLSNLGNALLTRFEQTGSVADLDAAVEACEQAVRDTPAGQAGRAGPLSNLAGALRARFDLTGAVADLDAAVEACEQAVEGISATDRDRAAILSNLGNALRARFGQTGLVADLDAAVTAGQQAVQATPAGHPDRAGRLGNLGGALVARFDHGGLVADLDAAAEACEQAVQAISAGHPDRAGYLSTLGGVLRTRFERGGTAADLDAVVEACQQAVQETLDGHPDHAGCLSNLGGTLLARFQRTGAVTDLDDAITCYRGAVQATPAAHPDHAAMLSSLGAALHSRFDRTGSAADLDAAVAAGQQAVQVTPVASPDRAARLSNLGGELIARFEHTGSTADLDAAVAACSQAVQAAPADHPDRARYLSNLGLAFLSGFERTGSAADLDAAVEACQQAAQAAPADHPDRARCLSNLGLALRYRFERTGIDEDRDSAAGMYEEAAGLNLAATSLRIRAGRAAASLVAGVAPGRAAGLLEAAVLLLPEVAPRFLERGDQQFAISRFAGLAADAAALALSDPAVPETQRPARALRLLEGARGVLLSQALTTRSDLSDLRELHPELAERFAELRDLLDRPSPAAGLEPAQLPGGISAAAHHRLVQDRRKAAEEFTGLLARIRSLEGFSTFSLPPSAEQLHEQAEPGPVVVFNVSSHRSDALLLTKSGITSQPLPGLDQATLTGQVNAFHQALDTIVSAGSPQDSINGQMTLREVLAWLWDNAAGPVLDTLGYGKPPAAGQPWPRLWWVPGGLLSLLPLHAAGHHTSPLDSRGRTVMDRVISSYAPTVGALAHARLVPATMVPATDRSLIVAMPTTPGLPGEGRLNYVLAEADLLRTRLPQPVLLTEPSLSSDATVGQVPTKAIVLQHLPGCAIAHFACHGYTDPADPSRSQLLLHDHRYDPLSVAALAPLALDHAQLAYLSACGTARMTNTHLLDEAIHLTSAFQLAGFPHVIGTLWEINDAVAVKIADGFYAALTGPNGTLDPSRAALALHQAVRAQRDLRPTTPYVWASYIHAGA